MFQRIMRKHGNKNASTCSAIKKFASDKIRLIIGQIPWILLPYQLRNGDQAGSRTSSFKLTEIRCCTPPSTDTAANPEPVP